MRIIIGGADELSKLLDKMPVIAKNDTRITLKKCCIDLKSKAQKITPVDTGDLQGSAFYSTSETTSGLSAIVGFTESYATRQHEELTYKHKSPGQAKYLEQPYKENIRKYINAISNTIKKAVETSK